MRRRQKSTIREARGSTGLVVVMVMASSLVVGLGEEFPAVF